MIELNNETAADDQEEFRFYENSNLVSTENIKNLNHRKRKRKAQDSIEDNLEKQSFNNIIKKNKGPIKVIVQIQVHNSTNIYR
jgi:hypothetical protein